jgi:Flp pilus assembly pilin Flp
MKLNPLFTRVILISISLIFFSVLNAQTQIGLDIDGEEDGHFFGSSVSLSSDGSTLAIGATGAEHVKIYKNVSDKWTQIGSNINGEKGSGFGKSVSLSGDGDIVAIGATGRAGQVSLYENIRGKWTQLGSDIEGEEQGDDFGHSVSLSGDGITVAVGAPHNNGNGTNSGQVKLYKNINSVWTQVGLAIDGEEEEDWSGSSVSLSSDGAIVAIGAPFNDGNNVNLGHVRLYKNVSGTWTQIGSDIDGRSSGGWSGYSVSLSSDGTIVAIGSLYAQVSVYKNINDTWTQVGSKIEDKKRGSGFGSAVSLSSDGSTIAIGAEPYDPGEQIRNSVRVYKHESITDEWIQIGVDIEAEQYGDRFGYAVSLSSDGSTVAFGAPLNDIDGKPWANVGHVRVYDLKSIVGVHPNLTRDFIQVYPNPTTDEIKISVHPNILGTSYTVLNSHGQIVIEGKINSISTLIEIRSLSEGLYIIQMGDDLKQNFRVIKK